MKPSKRKSEADRFAGYLKRRWDEGCHNSAQLWREIKEQGYSGNPVSLRHYLTRWRKQLPVELQRLRRVAAQSYPKPMELPSARKLTWLLMDKVKEPTPEEQLFICKLEEACPEMAAAKQIAREFFMIMRKRKGEEFDSWLEKARKSEATEIRGFAEGLMRDNEAVKGALEQKWSNGQVEGQVNRLKLIKRQMYGRAKFDTCY